jgi:ribonucleoside-triphosphate reductase
MNKWVIKRNGEYHPYLPYKIEDAIKKAFRGQNIQVDESLIKKVFLKLEAKHVWSVEEIQDIIEKELFAGKYFDVMRAFMLHRHTRKLQREHVDGLNEDTTYIDCTQTIDEYVFQKDWRINANANTSYSSAGLINNVAGKVIANYWLDKVYTKEEGYAHRNGDFHIHDLDCLTGYCAGWSLRMLLNEGFNGVRGRVESRPPAHFREALGQMANFLGILQSEWAGAQAFSSFDTYLAPYVFKDQLSFDEVLKAIRSFVYNLNVPARWGQSPFTNITLDWVVPADLKEQIPTKQNIHLFQEINNPDLLEKAKSRGVNDLNELCYKHFQLEMNVINKAYYTVMTEGDSNGQPFTFPIPTVNITEDFDWYGENTDILFENTSKVGSSYFQNFIGSQFTYDSEGNKIENPYAYKPNAIRSMCCRLQLDLRELLKRGNGLFGSAEMTGSIGVVTINMARLGYL